MFFDVDVTKRLGDTEIVCRFTTDSRLTALVGPSGAGKTSVLDMIAGLRRPDRGHVRVAGQALFGAGLDVSPERRRVGYVFQEPRLFPHLSVARNLLYGAPDDRRLGEIAAMLDIADLLDRHPRTLSGGEARRVAIGRALLSDPAFLLLDEPLSSLDRVRREAAMQAIEAVRDRAGLPILMVTHDSAEARRLAGQVIEIER